MQRSRKRCSKWNRKMKLFKRKIAHLKMKSKKERKPKPLLEVTWKKAKVMQPHYKLSWQSSRNRQKLFKHRHNVRSWWRHQMGTFSALLAFCEGNPPVTGGFPSQRPMTRSFDVLMICTWTNGWANKRDAGDLRRHYDVIIIISTSRANQSALLVMWLPINLEQKYTKHIAQIWQYKRWWCT